jgi:hypothetical protein
MPRFARLLSVSSFVALGALSASVHAAPILIDGLTQGSFNLTTPGTSSSAVGTNNTGADTLDGNRALMFNQFFGSNANATLPAGGPLAVNSGFSSLVLAYGDRFNGSNLQGNSNNELHANLAGTIGIQFDFASVSGQVSFTLNLITDHNGLGSLTNGNPGDQFFATSSAGKFTVPLSGLQTIGAGVDLSKVDYMELTLTGGSYTLNSISAVGPVPEPASIGLLVVGGMALARRRRR